MCISYLNLSTQMSKNIIDILRKKYNKINYFIHCLQCTLEAFCLKLKNKSFGEKNKIIEEEEALM